MFREKIYFVSKLTIPAQFLFTINLELLFINLHVGCATQYLLQLAKTIRYPKSGMAKQWVSQQLQRGIRGCILDMLVCE